MIFQRIPFTNVCGRKFDFAVKKSKVIFGPFLISLVDFESKMLYIKIQHQNCRFWRTRVFSSSKHEVLMVNYYVSQCPSSVVRRQQLLKKPTPPTSLGQFDSILGRKHWGDL